MGQRPHAGAITFSKGRHLSWDPYAALGVPKSSSAEDIRKAYRKLAKELHPDVRPNDKATEERFKRVTAAFNLLTDATLRGRFDRGEIDAEGNERPQFQPGGFGGFAGAGAGARARGAERRAWRCVRRSLRRAVQPRWRSSWTSVSSAAKMFAIGWKWTSSMR